MRRFRDHARLWPVTLLVSGGWLGMPATPASAQVRSVPVSLEVSGSEEAEACISETKLRRRVEDRLRRALSSADQASLHIKATVFQGPEIGAAGFRARLVIRDNKGVVGEREFVDVNRPCATLLETLVLAVTLMIDPDGEISASEDSGAARRPALPPSAGSITGESTTSSGTAAESERSAGTAGAAPGNTTATPTESAAPKTAPAVKSTPPAKANDPAAAQKPKSDPAAAASTTAKEAAERNRNAQDRDSSVWGVRLFGNGRHAVLPGFTWGGGAGFVLFPDSVGAEVSGALWPSATAQQGELSVVLTYLEGRLQICPPVVSTEGLRWAPCLGLHLGSVHASGRGLDEPAEDRALVAQVSAGSEVSARFFGLGQAGSVWGFLRLSGLVPFVRPRVVYLEVAETSQLYEAPAGGAELEAGFRFEFR